MAKAAETPASAAPARKKKLPLLILLIVVAVAVGGGAFAPMLLPKKGSGSDKEAKGHAEFKPVTVPFGSVHVNLQDGRLNRFIKVNLLLVVDHSDEKDLTELVAKKKAFLVDWLISYLGDLSLEDVSGKASQNRMRREIRDQFNALLFSDGPGRINDILFEEFLIQ